YGGGMYDNTTDEVSASTFRISPGIRMGFTHGKFYPYARAGLLFGLFNKIIDNSVETAKSPANIGADITEKKYEMTQGNSFGSMGALGLKYSISDHISIFAEVGGYMNNWAPLKGELIKATLNGTDIMGSLNTSDKQFEFKDKVDNSMNSDQNSPTIALKKYFPMSSLGFTLGMHFTFGG
ncbi:MAG TPA: hypothetical protein VFJ43_03645, partial [Bacteroidia bacterium]|nr:hypothetical protein [Bacteroidia bacterium]